MFQSPGKIALQLGPVEIHWYGIMIALGIFTAYFVSMRLAKMRNANPETLERIVFWIVLSGIAGARLYYVVFQWHYFSRNLLEIPQLWNGGLAIHGGLIGGFLAFFLVVKKHHESWLQYADLIVPGLALAQAIGRWGNFFNSEAFGRPTNLPWALFIPSASRPAGLESFSAFHPTFLYESLWDFGLFLLLMFLAKNARLAKESLPSGTLFCLYLILYSLARFFIEGLRMDSLMVGGFRTAQLMSVVLMVVGVFGFIKLRGKKSA